MFLWMVLVQEEKEEVITLVEQQWAKGILRELWGWMLTYIQNGLTLGGEPCGFYDLTRFHADIGSALMNLVCW